MRFSVDFASSPWANPAKGFSPILLTMMTKLELTAAVLTAKARQKLTWAAIAQAAGLSEVYTTSACLGENALEAPEAEKVVALLELPQEAVACFGEWCNKGEAAPSIPKEPLQYRLQEIIYGD